MNVSVDSGVMKDEPFAASQSIIQERIRGRTKPYFQDVEKENLVLSVTFAFEDAWDRRRIQEVKRWLTEPTYYTPLIFSDDPEKIYYALYVDEPLLHHNSKKEGYITIRFECNDAYAYSPELISQEYNWDTSPLIIAKSNFNDGSRVGGVTINELNQVTLNTSYIKWSDLPSNWTWLDLYENS